MGPRKKLIVRLDLQQMRNVLTLVFQLNATFLTCIFIKNENIIYYQCINNSQKKTKTVLERKIAPINEKIIKSNQEKYGLRGGELRNMVP